MATQGAIHTVRVSNVSAKATEHDIQDFFSFSGEIDHIELHKDGELSQVAFVTFKEEQALETALLLSGATVVDQAVSIAPAAESERLASAAAALPHDLSSSETADSTDPRAPPKSAQDVFSNMLARGFVLGNNAMSKAKAFDEKHQLTANASQLAANAKANVVSIDKKIGITEKFSASTAALNQQVKSVDEKYHVSEKTRSAVLAAEQKINDAGTAIAKNRYVLTGTSWAMGAYAKVAKTAGDVTQKAMEKVATLGINEQRPGSTHEGYAPPPYTADEDDVPSRATSTPSATAADQLQSEPGANHPHTT